LALEPSLPCAFFLWDYAAFQWMENLLMEPNNWFLFLFLMFLKSIFDATRFRLLIALALAMWSDSVSQSSNAFTKQDCFSSLY